MLEEAIYKLTSYLAELTLKDGLETESYIQLEFHQARNGSALSIYRS